MNRTILIVISLLLVSPAFATNRLVPSVYPTIQAGINAAVDGDMVIVADGVFIFAGMKPNLELFVDELELDQFGYVKIDEDMRTNLPDIYAVGDVVSKKYRQITTAVADGTIAAIAITKEIDV